MINKYIIANLKMNMSTTEISEYLKKINKKIFVSNLIICPTSIYIPYFLNHSYDVGIQNIFYENDGPFTGEISPKQASSLGIKYAIIGHSDRRNIGEDNLIINKKIKKTLENGMKVILCIGETFEEREMFKTDRVLKQQILSALRGISKKDFTNILIAYEPVWAVGTNKLPNKKEIGACISFIKNICKINLEGIPFILYGGSINEKNIIELNEIDDVDGFLIGNSSCNADKLIKIIDVIEKNKM